MSVSRFTRSGDTKTSETVVPPCYNYSMNTQTTVLQLRKGDTLDDGFVVAAPARVTTIGGNITALLDGHYGNGVVTTRRFLSDVPVFVVPS